MISKAFQKLKSTKTLIIGAVCLLVLVLITAGIAWHVSGAVTGAGKSVIVNYVYKNPLWSNLFNPYYTSSQTISQSNYEGELFSDKHVEWKTNPGGSLTLIGPDYVKTFAEFMKKNGDYNHVPSERILDCETFYLDKPDPTTQGLQWAYTFVGWHIVGADTYIPMETVFQMGDVIPAHVAEQYDLNKTDNAISLNFETLWARCFFVQDATDANGAATGAGTYVYNINDPQAETRYGNDPKRPLSSIWEAYRARNATFTADVNINGTEKVGVATEIHAVTFNAYSHAIMLTGDTTCKRTNGVNGEYRMFSSNYRAHSVTFKSLQATRSNSGVITRSDGKRHKLTMGLYGYPTAEFYIIASTRFDNVDYYQDTELIFEVRDAHPYAASTDLPDEDTIKNNHYFETTSRFTTSKKDGLNDLFVRAYTCEKMVLNGGKLGGVYSAWALPEQYSQDVLHTWYFGRNVDVSGTGSTMIGFNRPESGGAPYTSNDRVIITGGHFTTFYGAGSSMGDNTAVTGNRDYLLYGKQNNSGYIDASHMYEYDPKIDNFYGGGEYYKLNGNITIKGYGCSYLNNLYAGGKFYPAVVTGNITSTFEDCDFGGTVSGGGQYADTTGDGKGIINLTFKEGSTVAGNVYGSGMGYVTTFVETESDEQTKPEGWDYTAPTGFPAAEVQDDGSVWILTSRYKTIGTVTGSSNLRYIVNALYSFVSTAKANSTNVVLDKSTVTGDLFGGGDYASVDGDTHVTVQNGSTVKGSVFGGSDSTRIMPALELYKPYEGTYTAPTAYGQTINYGTAYSNTFTWDDDESLKSAGIDFTNFRVYTNAQKGEIGGSTFVSITSGSRVEHKVYGGGNAGNVTGNTSVTIDAATIAYNTFGGGQSGSVGGNTTVKFNNATTPQSIFGGCYAGNVGGKIDISVSGTSSIGFYIFGGNDVSGTITGPITVNMTGGTVSTDIYGTSRNANYNGTSTLNISGGSVVYDVYGGGFQGSAGDINVNISGNASIGRYLFGGCDGERASVVPSAKSVTMTLAGNCSVGSAAFGGGHTGTVSGNTSITMSGGTISPAPADQYTDVFNGGNRDSYGLYGGGYSGTVSGNTSVTISGGTVRSCVFGGGERAAVNGTTTVSITGGTHFDGTGAYNDIKWTASSTFDKNGLPFGVYGGGYGANATVAGTTLNFSGSANIRSNVFGGGYSGAVLGDTHINTSGSAALGDLVFGGGMQGNVNGSTHIVSACAAVHNMFGGGYSASVGVDTYVEVNAGTFDFHVYGGNQQSGDIGGKSSVIINGGTIKGYVFGGGQNATTDADTYVTINGGTIATVREPGNAGVYGGGYQAGIGNTNVVINGGTIGDANYATSKCTGAVYGGSFGAAATAKSTNVTYGGTGSPQCYGPVYGGGNMGSVTNGTIVKFTAGTTVGGLYGGSNQGSIGTNTHVTVSGGSIGDCIYGGGNKGAVNGNTTVIMSAGSAISLLGGGNEGNVNGNTSVTFSGGTLANELFGGGNQGDVNGNIDLTVVSGELSYVFGGNNTSGVINGNITVNIKGGTIDELYGGGSKAHINSDTANSISLNISDGTIGKAFGGGMLAYTSLTPKVTVTGGDIASLYGGGYQAATVGSDVTVKNGTIGSLYGGGYAGAVTDTKVLIDDSAGGTITIKGNVYGGGEGITATVNNSTSVTINTDCSFTATEEIIASNEITPSGAVETLITRLSHRSQIKGSVYGGGDLGRVGEGIIYVGGESAHIGNAGTTNVMISNGYIGGNVFAGGRGIPAQDASYDVTMGVVFGSTNLTINGGYIGFDPEAEGNVYGGGEQSRVYSDGQATNVDIREVSGRAIAIKGSVFGGGDRGEAGATNASVPTVMGKTDVTIAGYQKDVPSKIYFLSGGVYGDGNLCLVKGERTITLENFEAEEGKLKTFFSLQRADTVIMNNAAVVLRGAIDKVAEDDGQEYSINRVGHLQMTKGSTVKLEQVVKFLGELSSDVHADRHFIHLGNNGNNHYVYDVNHSCDGSCLEVLDSALVNAYRSGNAIDEHGHIHDSSNKNVVSVANGLYLEVKDENGKYGPVTGLFTLQLLYANPGEGGGFVYGSIPESTGDFICETYKWDYNVIAVDSATFNNNASKQYYVRVPGNGYELAPATFDAGQTYYTANESTTYMDIIDNVGGYRNSQYSYYYWYIGGPEVRYDISITGYLGTGNTSDRASVNIPHHAENISYVLYGVDVNNNLIEALSGATPAYVLAENANNLTGNQIAIEVMLGDQSLGFLTKVDDTWAINSMVGYRGTISEAKNNLLFSGEVVDKSNDTITWVLHKAEGVNVVTRDMAIYLDIDKFEGSGDTLHNVTTDAANLSFSTYISIVRLLPTQNMYHDNLRSYTGVGTTSAITITGNSCFTVEYQTNYIPAAFPKNGKTMNWSLKSLSALPAKTKITMVDLSGEVPSYYYYICNEATNIVDLTKFMQMGTKTTIADLEQKPAFCVAYDNQTMGIFNERLLFVFDFEQAQGNLPAGTFSNTVTLQHLYDTEDIMTHDKDNGERSEPKSFTFNINKEATGLGQYTAAFDAESYSDNGNAILNVNVTEHAEWINTWFREYGFAIEVQLNNAVRMPSGMYISYMGQKYYPGADGKTISVPIYEFGDHALEICNPHGGLAEVLTEGNVAKYNISFYCAPDAKYHKNLSVSSTADTYAVEADTINSLQVTPPSGHGSIVAVGNTLYFTVNTDARMQTFALFAETVDVKLSRKVDGAYTAVDISSVFSDVGNVIRTGDQSWKLTGGESGTYRITFNYMNNTEYLNFIIP